MSPILEGHFSEEQEDNSHSDGVKKALDSV